MYTYLPYSSVEETGSLEAAAKKLHQVAIARAWEDDPEEAAYLAQNNGAWQAGEDDDEVVEDDDFYGYRGQGEEDEAIREVVHFQEIVPGLWVGDLVAAMDADGLQERGIVSRHSYLHRYPEPFKR